MIPFTISWLRNGEDSGWWGIAFKERLPLLSCFCGEKTSQKPQRSNGKLRLNNPKIARKLSQSTNTQRSVLGRICWCLVLILQKWKLSKMCKTTVIILRAAISWPSSQLTFTWLMFNSFKLLHSLSAGLHVVTCIIPILTLQQKRPPFCSQQKNSNRHPHPTTDLYQTC